MKYNKLVRDRIPEIIQRNGQTPITRIASDAEYFEKLKEKLKEEFCEFSENPAEEELADILEIVFAICDFKRINRKKLDALRKKKAKERGAFKKRIILEETKP